MEQLLRWLRTWRSVCRPTLWRSLLCGVLLFFSVFNIHSAPQATNQTLVQIVDDFEKTTSEINAKDAYATSSRASTALAVTHPKSHTRRSNLGVLARGNQRRESEK